MNSTRSTTVGCEKGPPASGHLLRASITAGPSLLWLCCFLLVPFCLIAAVAFLSRGDYGEIQLPVTLENFKRLLGFGLLGFDPLYPIILGRSLGLGLVTAAFCAAAALPLAFFIAGLGPRLRTAALILAVVPFWTNLLIRTYAWQLIFSPESWVTQIVHCIGGRQGQPLYPGLFAVTVGMVCDFLPFMVLPLYASVEKIDWTLAEAAADLGAHRLQVFRHALLPQILPGLRAGIILVFLPAMGQFIIPDLLGGAKTVMLGNIIQEQFGQARDWPFGSAMALTALFLVMAGIWGNTRQDAPAQAALG